MRLVPVYLACLAAAACVPATAPPQPVRAPVAAVPATAPAAAPREYGPLIGIDANYAKSVFGEPRIDVSERGGRKLQFANASCVLDLYLYPESPGGEATVAHADTRTRAGAPVDQDWCVNTLRQ